MQILVYTDPMQRTTLKDLAQAAGVSVAAVSLSLSGKGKISPDVTERIKRLAETMGYTRRSSMDPENSGKIRKIKYVAILQREDFPYLWNFSQPFATCIEEEVERAGYYPLILHIPGWATTRSLYKEILGARVGAVLALHFADAELFRDLERNGIPVIVINNSEYQDKFFSILADEVQGSYDATKILMDLGHTRIGYADYIRPQYPTLVNDRFFGYRKALEEFNLPHEEQWRLSLDLSDFETLVTRTGRILSAGNHPTAWAVHDDYYAACLQEAFLRHGLSVPRDISIIATGGDVLDYSVPFIPKIDTMRIDQKLMASMAVSLLEARLHGRSPDLQVLKTKLPYVERGSCRFDMD